MEYFDWSIMEGVRTKHFQRSEYGIIGKEENGAAVGAQSLRTELPVRNRGRSVFKGSEYGVLVRAKNGVSWISTEII